MFRAHSRTRNQSRPNAIPLPGREAMVEKRKKNRGRPSEEQSAAQPTGLLDNAEFNIFKKKAREEDQRMTITTPGKRVF